MRTEIVSNSFFAILIVSFGIDISSVSAQTVDRPHRVDPPPATLQDIPSIHNEPVFEILDIFEGRKTRIPTIAITPKGTLIATVDSGHLVRRSTDRGKTWSEPVQIDFKGGGNLIVDETNGDVLVLSGQGDMMRSRDDGKTWNREQVVVRSNLSGLGGHDSIAPFEPSCCESGITLKYGPKKGRLLMPGRILAPLGKNDQEHWMYHYNTSAFSDDHGKTWQVSSPVQNGTGEGVLAEFSDGIIYYNSRSHLSSDHRRQLAFSHDGGERYVDWEVCEDLREVGEPFYFKYGTKPSYGCNAGLTRLPLDLTNGKDVLLYCTPDNPGGDRFKMTVWCSLDRSRSWKIKRMIYKDRCAYSSMTSGPDGMAYILFECGDEKLPFGKVLLARFNLAWIFESYLSQNVQRNNP